MTEHTPGACPLCGRPTELNGLRFACDRQHSVVTPADHHPVYAAAPELLAALREAYSIYAPTSDQPETAWAAKARAAIAKATEPRP